MSNKIQCAVHGESEKTYVCTHLTGGSAGLGFNRGEPTKDNPFPDAWCDNCEIIRMSSNGWNEESESLAKISLLCSSCYGQARIRNTHTSSSLGDLANLRWKCGSCDQWHHGPCLDLGHAAPYYWRDEFEEAGIANPSTGLGENVRLSSFLGKDYCAIENRDFFVRGLLHLPIIGTAETFRWGVWGSVSRENFDTLIRLDDDPKRTELPPLFCWLSTSISGYPETLNLKMYAHIQEAGLVPNFELQPTEHPLSQEFHHGITPERVKELMFGRLADIVQDSEEEKKFEVDPES
jgi:hypothetical protein